MISFICILFSIIIHILFAFIFWSINLASFFLLFLLPFWVLQLHFILLLLIFLFLLLDNLLSLLWHCNNNPLLILSFIYFLILLILFYIFIVVSLMMSCVFLISLLVIYCYIASLVLIICHDSLWTTFTIPDVMLIVIS